MAIGRAYSDESLSELSNCGLPVEEGILPAQFHDLLHRSGERSGEHRMMLALLEDALHCWLGTANAGICVQVRRERAHREADAWIFGRYWSPLSFEQVCGWLDLNPDYVRRELLKLGKSAVREQSPVSVQRSARIKRARVWLKAEG